MSEAAAGSWGRRDALSPAALGPRPPPLIRAPAPLAASIQQRRTLAPGAQASKPGGCQRPGLNRPTGEVTAFPPSPARRQAPALAHAAPSPWVPAAQSPRAGPGSAGRTSTGRCAAGLAQKQRRRRPCQAGGSCTAQAAREASIPPSDPPEQLLRSSGRGEEGARTPSSRHGAIDAARPRSRDTQPCHPPLPGCVPPGPAPAPPAALPPPRSSGSSGRSTAAFLPGGSARALARSPAAASRRGKPAHCGTALPSPCARGGRAGSTSAPTGWQWAAPAAGHTGHESARGTARLAAGPSPAPGQPSGCWHQPGALLAGYTWVCALCQQHRAASG